MVQGETFKMRFLLELSGTSYEGKEHNEEKSHFLRLRRSTWFVDNPFRVSLLLVLILSQPIKTGS